MQDDFNKNQEPKNEMPSHIPNEAPPAAVSGKEAYEARKREKMARKGQVPGITKEEKRAKSHSRRKTIGWIVTILVIAALGYGAYVWIQSIIPDGPDLSQAVEIQSERHVAEGTEVVYSTNPPTSGDHYATPALPGCRIDDDLPDQNIVHSLEHGIVWVSFHPDVSESVKEELCDFGSNGAFPVIVTEREANVTDIGLSAWGRLDRFHISGDTLTGEEKQRIDDFIKRYANKGPERVPAGSHTGI